MTLFDQLDVFSRLSLQKLYIPHPSSLHFLWLSWFTRVPPLSHAYMSLHHHLSPTVSSACWDYIEPLHCNRQQMHITHVMHHVCESAAWQAASGGGVLLSRRRRVTRRRRQKVDGCCKWLPAARGSSVDIAGTTVSCPPAPPPPYLATTTRCMGICPLSFVLRRRHVGPSPCPSQRRMHSHATTTMSTQRHARNTQYRWAITYLPTSRC